jgi:hypothetical protein
LKPFYEIYLRGNRVIGIVSREVMGPARPSGSFPDSLYDIVPQVKELLQELGDQSAAVEKQEQREGAEAEDILPDQKE